MGVHVPQVPTVMTLPRIKRATSAAGGLQASQLSGVDTGVIVPRFDVHVSVLASHQRF